MPTKLEPTNTDRNVADRVNQQRLARAYGDGAVGSSHNIGPEREQTALSPDENAAFSDIVDGYDNPVDYSNPQDMSGAQDNSSGAMAWQNGAASDLQRAETATSAAAKQQSGRDISVQNRTGAMNVGAGLGGAAGKSPIKGGVTKKVKQRIMMWVGGGIVAVITGISIAGLFGPATLITTLVSKFENGIQNVLNYATQSHSNRILKKSLSYNYSCPAKIKSVCSNFHSMSERQQKKFKENGWKLYDENGNEITKISGKAKVKEIQPPDDVKLSTGNRRLTADNITTELAGSSSLRKSVRGTYNGKFATFADKIFNSFADKVGIKKKSSLPEGDADGSNKNMQKALDDDVNENKSESSEQKPAKECGTDAKGNTLWCMAGSEKDDDIYECGTAQANPRYCKYHSREEAENVSANAVGNIADADADDAQLMIDQAEKDIKSGSSVLNKAMGWFRMGDIYTSICQAYTTAHGVGTMVKMLKSEKIIKFAFQFFTIASAILAGMATAEQVQYLGNMLTTTMAPDHSSVTAAAETFKQNASISNLFGLIDLTGRDKIRVKSATDGAGLRYSLFGERMPTTESINEARASISSDDILGIFSRVLKKVPIMGNLISRHNCNVLLSSTVQFGLTIAGLATSAIDFIPIIGQSWGVARAAFKKGAKSLAEEGIKKVMTRTLTKLFRGSLNVLSNRQFRMLVLDYGKGAVAQNVYDRIVAALPALLVNAMKGKLIGDSTVGERAGDLLATGAGLTYQQRGKAGGLAPLSADGAKKYAMKTQEYMLAYAQEERVGSKWYDLNNQYTALGSVTTNLALKMNGAMQSPMAFVNKVLGVVSSGFGGVSSIATANADSTIKYVCEDEDYNESNIGCDYLGVPTYGQTVSYDFDSLALELAEKGYINEDGSKTPKFTKFEDACVNREVPIGSYMQPKETMSAIEEAQSLGENCLESATFDASVSSGMTSTQVSGIESTSSNVENSKLYDYLLWTNTKDSMDEEPNQNDGGGSTGPSGSIDDAQGLVDEFLSKYPSGDADGAAGMQCVDVSYWFMKDHTTLVPVSVDGGYMVSSFVNANPGKISISSTPTAPAIFSTHPGAMGSDPIHGHTGVVIAVDANGTITTIEQNIGGALANVYMHTKAEWQGNMDFANIPKEYQK